MRGLQPFDLFDDLEPIDKVVGKVVAVERDVGRRLARGGFLGVLLVERVGALETKDATRVRVKWYVTVALFNELKLAKLIGVRP